MPIPAAAITMPSPRAIAMLGRHGHLDRANDPTARWRTPFRLDATGVTGPPAEVQRALGVLNRIEPGAQWFAEALHPDGGLWAAWNQRTIATPSLRPGSSPMATIPSGRRWVIVDALPPGFPRLARGMHAVQQPSNELLRA